MDNLIDITRPLTSNTAVWPGDERFTSAWTARLGENSSVNIGRFAQSTHAGTHVDAPLHYERNGAASHELPLSAFIGPAVVVEVEGNKAIAPHHVADVEVESHPRILFKTPASRVDDTEWVPDFCFLLPETVRHLASRGCMLIGTDAPSVDPADSTDLPAHHALAASGIVNLENLKLAEVRAGTYNLVALPMALRGMDAAPVRAVLTSTGA